MGLATLVGKFVKKMCTASFSLCFREKTAEKLNTEYHHWVLFIRSRRLNVISSGYMERRPSFLSAGAPWHYLHEPLVGLAKAIADSCAEMCTATARVMGEFPDQDELSKLDKSIQALMNARLGLTPSLQA